MPTQPFFACFGAGNFLTVRGRGRLLGLAWLGFFSDLTVSFASAYGEFAWEQHACDGALRDCTFVCSHWLTMDKSIRARACNGSCGIDRCNEQLLFLFFLVHVAFFLLRGTGTYGQRR